MYSKPYLTGIVRKLSFAPVLPFALVLLVFTGAIARAQAPAQAQDDRFQVLEKRLKDLSNTVPGLKEKADLSVTDISLQDFLRGLATTHNLNLNIDPSLTQKMSNYFSDEPVIDILLYLARQFILDYTFIGSIITISPYNNPNANLPPPPKPLLIRVDSATGAVTFDLRDDTLSAVAKKITLLTNRNIVVLPELYDRKVTGYVQKMPLENALEKLAITNSFKLNITKDSVFILEPLRADEELVAKDSTLQNANYSIRRVTRGANSTGSSLVEVNDDGGQRKVTLNVVNAPLKDIVRNMAEQARINYFEYSDLAGNATASVSGMEFLKALRFILGDTKYTFSIDHGVYMIGDRRDEGLRQQRLVQLHNRSVDSLVAVIPADLRQGVEIKEFKELNGILLSGSGPQVDEIEKFLQQIDKVVPMITLEVILLDVTRSRTVSTGISAGTSDSVRPGGSIIGSGGLNYTLGTGDVNSFLSAIGVNNVFNLGKVAPNFYVTLTAMESNSNVHQRQTPKLSTLNGHAASLSIGNTEYYAISTQNVLGSLSPQTVVTQQFVPVEANLSIDITPFVAGDDEVTMNIAVNITNFTSTTTTTTQPPPTSTSKFKSIIRVRNQDMIVLGGIESTQVSESGSGWPILSRLPILKWIFGTHTKSNTKMVSIVFIRPTIYYQ